MKTRCWTAVLLTALLLLTSCKGEKKLTQYTEVYQERPLTIYVAPIVDHAEHRAVRTIEDSAYNVSVDIATKQLYLTASDPLVVAGYYVLGPLASAQIAATETRSVKQLHDENINDYATDLGVDAILFLTVKSWNNTHNSWSVEVEYSLRSTHTGSEVMHMAVNATKLLHTDFKGKPKPLPDDLAFAKQYGCDLQTAQRCRLVETVNKYVLKDLPVGSRARALSFEQKLPSHLEYLTLYINPDGSVMVVPVDE